MVERRENEKRVRLVSIHSEGFVHIGRCKDVKKEFLEISDYLVVPWGRIEHEQSENYGKNLGFDSRGKRENKLSNYGEVVREFYNSHLSERTNRGERYFFSAQRGFHDLGDFVWRSVGD